MGRQSWVITRVLREGSRRGREIGRCCAALSVDGEVAAVPGRGGHENGPRASTGGQPAHTSILIQWDPFQSLMSGLGDNKFVLFSAATFMVICYSNNKSCYKVSPQSHKKSA